jgi:hypothetical protein
MTSSSHKRKAADEDKDAKKKAKTGKAAIAWSGTGICSVCNASTDLVHSDLCLPADIDFDYKGWEVMEEWDEEIASQLFATCGECETDRIKIDHKSSPALCHATLVYVVARCKSSLTKETAFQEKLLEAIGKLTDDVRFAIDKLTNKVGDVGQAARAIAGHVPMRQQRSLDQRGE